MCQTITAEDHQHATGPGSAQADPAAGTVPKWVRVGRGTYPFTSYPAASAAYCATIERLDLGVSETPRCEVLDDTGTVIARVAYNGRVFAVTPDGESDCTMVLHETASA